ncbi:MAG: flippase-like domain-containing protein, partial [Desulfobacterales bacterium]|nr:flippase-like domain-containing protein [Desulfobacterales bacterium]
MQVPYIRFLDPEDISRDLLLLAHEVLIIHNIGFSNLYSTIVRANLSYFILAVVLQASSILVRNLKWQIFVNGIKKAPFFSLLAMLLAGSFMDTATPGPQ